MSRKQDIGEISSKIYHYGMKIRYCLDSILDEDVDLENKLWDLSICLEGLVWAYEGLNRCQNYFKDRNSINKTAKSVLNSVAVRDSIRKICFEILNYKGIKLDVTENDSNDVFPELNCSLDDLQD